MTCSPFSVASIVVPDDQKRKHSFDQALSAFHRFDAADIDLGQVHRLLDDCSHPERLVGLVGQTRRCPTMLLRTHSFGVMP